MTKESKPAPRGALSKALHVTIIYIKRYRYLSILSVLTMITCMVYARVYFPSLPTFKVVLGGIFFGLFCVVCGIGYHLFEID
jgi:hypothetical protein